MRTQRLVALSLLGFISACATPLSMAPVNRTLNLALPPVHNGVAPQEREFFSFRIITPVENVDIFKILQATGVAQNKFTDNTVQNTLPVDQLQEVIIAKEKIVNSEFLKPEEAGTLAFETSRLYNWDTEVARQVMVEIVKTYYTHRDREVAKFRQAAEERAQYLIGLNRIKQNEVNDQASTIYEPFFTEFPNPQPESLEEIRERRLRYAEYMQRQYEKNMQARAEYAEQAKASTAAWLTQLDEQRRKAREKEAAANKQRGDILNSIIEAQQAETPAETPAEAPAPAQMTIQSLNTEAPYSLVALSNGDFMVDSREALPPLIQLRVDEFNQPILIPAMPQTQGGRLLISIDKDAQGRPVVYGGQDSLQGSRFDLNAVLFTLSYNQAGQQELLFTHPNGLQESYQITQLQNIAPGQLNGLEPTIQELNSEQLQSLQSVFSAMRYQYTPNLSLMNAEKALEILNGVRDSL